MPEAQLVTETVTPPPVELSSGDKSLTGPTPTPTQPGDTPTPTVAPDEGQPVAAAPENPPASDQPANDDGKAKAPWFQKRIDQLTWEKNEERREKAAMADQNKSLLAELEKLRTSRQLQAATEAAVATAVASTTGQPVPVQTNAQQPAAKPAVQMSEAEIEARALDRARQIAAKQNFDKACNKIADDGKNSFSDFPEALRTFDMLGGIPPTMLDAIVDMPNAHKILYAVGKDPELADRIIKMPASRMGMELARVESSLKTPPKAVSTAPRPITPIDTSATAQPDPEKMSTSEWISWRNKTKTTKW